MYHTRCEGVVSHNNQPLIRVLNFRIMNYEKSITLKNTIEIFITHLDEDEDSLIIEILRQKITSLGETYLTTKITDKEWSKAANGIVQTLNYHERQLHNEYLDSDDKYRKAEDVHERMTDCKKCSHAITHYHNHKGWRFNFLSRNKDSEICKSCSKWGDKLYDFMKVRDKFEYRNPHDVVCENNDLVNCKVLVNSIKKRLKTIMNENK
jgi:hypothetical protein